MIKFDDASRQAKRSSECPLPYSMVKKGGIVTFVGKYFVGDCSLQFTRNLVCQDCHCMQLLLIDLFFNFCQSWIGQVACMAWSLGVQASVLTLCCLLRHLWGSFFGCCDGGWAADQLWKHCQHRNTSCFFPTSNQSSLNWTDVFAQIK